MIEFKDIPGYEGHYQAGTDGTIRSVDKRVRQWSGTQLKRGKVLSPAIDKIGYLNCALSKENKLRSFKVHRLVGLAHIPNPNNLPEINHKDGNKLNNHISNLEWCDRSHNINHAVRTGLLKPRIGDENWKTLIKSEHHQLIKELFAAGLGAPKIGALFKCSYTTIYRIVNPEKYAKRKNVQHNEITI